MAAIRITALCAADAEELLAFEQANRAYFASHVPDRPDVYFDLAWLRGFLAELEAEQARGESFMYLVRNEAGELVGRVNLTNVQRGERAVVHLGYRIGERHLGKGYATEAVRLGLEALKAQSIDEVRAMTTVTNVGSQVVLRKVGFVEVNGIPESLDVNGTHFKAVHFTKALT